MYIDKVLQEAKKRNKKKNKELSNACWDGYEAYGTKTKNGREVPNCVPKNEAEEWEKNIDAIVEAEYQGRKVELNKKMKGDVKKSKVYVRDPKSGNVKKVEFGDPNMTIKKSNPKRRKSFRARHNCKDKKDKTTAGYWSCKSW
jgi:hypothetical protein